MKKAIMLGAGNIGRGFIGMLLEKSGYHVVFADINQAVIDDINHRKEYTVHLVDTECIDTTVRNISAMSSLAPELVREMEEASLVCTSVGLTALPRVAPVIAKGIAARKNRGISEFWNVIACENAVRGSSLLKSYVYALLSAEEQEYAAEYTGFPDCAVDRIIPPNRGLLPADVVVERYCEWDVEISGFKGALPAIEGMDLVEHLDAYLERKLFTLNGPNAVTAYFGHIKGCETIKEALEDGEIYDTVCGMMAECGRMLEIRHGFTADAMEKYISLLMRRFKNPYVLDDVIRVAREPIRKLSPTDRIIAPMNYAHSYGIATPCYYTGIALAFLYREPADAQSLRIQEMVAEKGLSSALETVCGIGQDSKDSEAIQQEYRRLKVKFN